MTSETSTKRKHVEIDDEDAKHKRALRFGIPLVEAPRKFITAPRTLPHTKDTTPTPSPAPLYPSPSRPCEEPPRKKIMVYSEEELRERKRHFGSTLSVMDRKKFEREFNVTSLNLDAKQLGIYESNPHIRQVQFRTSICFYANTTSGICK